MATKYRWYTPKGNFNTLKDAARSTGHSPKSIHKWCKREYGPNNEKGWYRQKKKPIKPWRYAPHHTLSPNQLKKAREYKKQYARQWRQKNIYDKRTPEEQQAIYEKKRLHAIQLAEKNKNNLKNFWKNLTDKERKEIIEYRTQKQKEAYWSKIKNVDKHKEKIRQRQRNLKRKIAKKYNKKISKIAKQLTKEKHNRLEGTVIHIDRENGVYQKFINGYWNTIKLCENCNKEILKPSKNTKCCSRECYGEKWGRMEHYKKVLPEYIKEGISNAEQASRLGISIKYLYYIRGVLGLSKPRADALTTWVDRSGNLKTAASILKDDNPETGERYLPDEIESQMDELDDFFDSL